MNGNLFCYCQAIRPTLNLFTVVYLIFDFLIIQKIWKWGMKALKNLKRLTKTSKEELVVNSKKHNNIEIEKTAKMLERPEDAEKVIQGFKEK